jgi:fluoride exporter
MKALLWIGLGSALGGMARYGVAALLARQSAGLFPTATLLVNVSGSFLIGLIYVLTAESGRWPAPEIVRNVLMAGFLGGYTTFSSFSIQTVHLMEKGEWGLVMANVLGSVMLCIGGAWLGQWVGRQMG